ncbi:MAG: hypothetical protein KA383_17260 [Phycisphaerae bacterium]|nr:hypothetical protein [Phycisphaerae bacterium]
MSSWQRMLGVALGVLVLSCVAWGQEDDTVVRYDQHKLVRVYTTTTEQVAQLRDLRALLMSDAEGPGLVDYVIPPESMPGLQALGVPFKVLNDNIQKDIDAERERLARAPAVDERDPAWFSDYKNLDAVNAKLNAMVADRPDLVSLIDVGTTLQGRHIYGVRISGPGTNKPAILFNGCHHAREWISVMVPMWIADKLVYTYETDPTIQSLVNRVEFFVIPVVNLDGYVYCWTNNRLWRKNRRLNSGGCYGVDDNRNYATGWGGGGSSSDPCSDLYRGTAAFSEPETAAMRDFTIANPQIVVTQSYHSYSQLIMSPYGYTSALPPEPDQSLFMELNEGQHDLIKAVHGMEYGYGPIYSTIYQASGGDVDWYYATQGIFSFTIELRDTGTYQFELPPEQIIPTCEENFPAAVYLAEWAASPVKIGFPNGLPTRLTPDTPETVPVRIVAVGATLDTASPRLFTRVGSSGAFTEYTLTSLGSGLYEATLPATTCGLTRYYYLSAATTTGIVNYSPADAPETTYNAAAEPIVTIYSANMDSNPGWTKSPNTAANQWAWGDPTGGGGEYGSNDPNVGFTGTNVVGYNLAGDYANNLAEMSITTPAIDCSGVTGPRLGFYRWLGVEQPLYDHAYLRISTNGLAWTNLWQNTATVDDGAWVYQEFDISAQANNQATVYLRWTMGTTDGGWRYCGWNVDDVQIWAADPSGCPELLGDLNCDGVVGFGDINPFVLALANPDTYTAMYPDCDINLADVNDDGTVSFGDINPFVALLTAQ